MKIIQLPSLAAMGFCCCLSASAQTWTQTSAPNAAWGGIAMSADGTRLVAVSGVTFKNGSIYTSTNSGITWISNNAPQLDWISVCSSADGLKLAANTYYRAGTWTNSGTTWAKSSCPLSSFYRSSIASSADGNSLIASTYYLIFLSTNRGATWKTISNLTAGQSCAMSADARVMLVNGAPYLSTNSGTTWVIATNTYEEMRAAAVSVDGKTLIAMGDFGVWASTNSGIDMSWFKETNAPRSGLGSMASSSDGTHLIIATAFDNSPLYISTNSGLTWATTSAPSNSWITVASSADGNTLAAAVNGGGIWMWRKKSSPLLNITATNDLQLSWLIPSTNFVVQESSNLADWADVTNAPVLNLTNLQNQVTLPASSNNHFFRLKTP